MDLNKILLELNWNVLLWDLVFNFKKKNTQVKQKITASVLKMS